jgi:uncharacterized protein RhaS with RHS repeats
MTFQRLRRQSAYVTVALLLSGAAAHASETISYAYDAQGRLVTATHTGTVNNNVTATYSFDLADNRTNVTIFNAASRVIVVPLNGLTVIPIPDP